METTAKPADSRPDRPGFFIVAILLHVVEGLFLLLGSALGALGLAIDRRALAEQVRAQRPDLKRGDFFHAFPFAGDALRGRIDGALAQHGF